MLFMGPRLAVGADGRHYVIAGATAIEWELVQGVAQAKRSSTWDIGGLNIFIPSDAGVSAESYMWLFYGQSFSTARLVWVDANGRLLTNIEGGLRNTTLIGLDALGQAFACGSTGRARCLMFDRSAGAIVWDMTLPTGVNVVGGALDAGRLYVTTADGMLYALGASTNAALSR
jgi:outer membrane protein assembly factor BamB